MIFGAVSFPNSHSLSAKRAWLTGKITSKLLFPAACLLVAFLPTKVWGAERVYINYGPVEFSLPISSLTAYAKEGKIDSELEIYAGYVNSKQLSQLREALLTRIDVTPVATSQFLYSPIGEILLQRLGEVIQTKAHQSGFYALRSALILSAASPDGLTLLNVLQKFPTYGIRLNSTRAFEIVDELSRVIQQTEKAIAAIEKQSSTEINAKSVNFSQMIDLRQSGPISFTKKSLVMNDAKRDRSFPVDLYLPDIGRQNAPVIVISHGFGNDRSTFIYLAEHLVSYGFAVAVLEHPGSNAKQLQAIINGLASEVVPPKEFVDRPLDIKYLLNQLERDFSINDRLNLQQVGVIGQSFGGYTALALAGAEINFDQLAKDCLKLDNTLNLSLLLQCRAVELNQAKFDLHDSRIKAAIAINPVDSSIYGATELAKINVPVMLVASSADTVAPPLLEQIQPFTWLTTKEKYLVLLKQGTHFSTLAKPDPNSTFIPLSSDTLGPDPTRTYTYMKALSTAFFQTHLSNNSEYSPYLSAGYAQLISQEPISLILIKSLTPNQIDGLVETP